MGGEGPVGHRRNDTMFAILGESLAPGQALDVWARYNYDDLIVARSGSRQTGVLHDANGASQGTIA